MEKPESVKQLEKQAEKPLRSFATDIIQTYKLKEDGKINENEFELLIKQLVKSKSSDVTMAIMMKHTADIVGIPEDLFNELINP